MWTEMSDPSGDPSKPVSRPIDEPERPNGETRYPEIELRSVVVRYEERPDRCTIYPRRDRCCEQVDAWLSADADSFVPLDEMQ
jgi:hypothetical protein